jgi:glycosyltransferase involved in cell wall biosynthesis
MKVLHISSALTGGAGIAASNLHEELLQNGVDSSILNSKSGRFFSKFLSKAITVVNMVITKKDYDLLTVFSINTVTKRKIKRINPDIIHIHNWFNTLSLRQIEKLSKKYQIILTLHDERMFTGGCHNSQGCENFHNSCANCPRLKLFQKWPRKNYERQKLLSNSDVSDVKFISPSGWLVEKNSNRFFDRNNSKIEIIPNIISTADLTVSKKENSGDIIKLLFVASDCSVKLKGLDILLESLRILHEQNVTNFSLTVVGDRFILESNPENLSISHIARQPKSKMSRIYQDHDFTVVPSRSDNSPNVILESFSVGTPVIGSRRGGIPHLIKVGKNGQLFDPTPNSLAEVIMSIMNKENIFWDSWKIREDYNANFSKKVILERHISLYKKLLKNG